MRTGVGSNGGHATAAIAIAVVAALGMIAPGCVGANPLFGKMDTLATDTETGSESEAGSESTDGSTTGDPTTGEFTTGSTTGVELSSSSGSSDPFDGSTTTGSSSSGSSADSSSSGLDDGSSSTGPDEPCAEDGGDEDLDGVCDEYDNGLGAANPEQLDSDGDDVGDVCDVCKAGPWYDDLADYDGDGIFCKDDPCIFDGGPIDYPQSVGPEYEITVSNADINNTGTPFDIVAPGQQISVSYDWDLTNCGCPGCITQGLVGITGKFPLQCFYDNVPACIPQAGFSTMFFPAPLEPGIHTFRFRHTLQFQCQDAVNAPLDNPNAEFAAVCVMPW